MNKDEVIKILEGAKDWNGDVPFDLVKKGIEKLAIPTERETGKWIDTGSGQECDQCHEIQYGYDSGRKFCANCGAKMEVNECN